MLIDLNYLTCHLSYSGTETEPFAWRSSRMRFGENLELFNVEELSIFFRMNVALDK